MQLFTSGPSILLREKAVDILSQIRILDFSVYGREQNTVLYTLPSITSGYVTLHRYLTINKTGVRSYKSGISALHTD